MVKFQPMRMQKRPLQFFYRALQFRRQTAFSVNIVNGISHYRMPDMCQVGTNLMSPACFELNFQHRNRAEMFFKNIMSNCRPFSMSLYRHLFPVFGISAEWHVDSTGCRRRVAVDESQVFLFHASVFELLCKSPVCKPVFGYQHYSTGKFV